MKDSLSWLLAVSLVAGALSLQSASAVAPGSATLAPLTTWSPNSDGWLAPGEGGYAYLTTGSTERGLAYGNGHVYLVSRASGNNIRILDAATGADLGALNTSGISGGTFAVNAAGVSGDGTIYVANLTTADSSGSPFKVYSWATEASTPTLAYTSGGTLLAGGRIGDDLAAIGSGSSTLLAAGFGNVSVNGYNGYAIVNPNAATGTAIGFSGTPPNGGDFRLGVTFADSSHVIGTAGSSLYRYTSFSGSSGTLVASPVIPDPSGATADRLLSFNVLGGKPLLAVQSIGDSHVSIYDMTDPTNPIWLASGDNTVSPASNANGTGELAWGAVTVNGDGTVSETLYAMSSNQGIQAFVVTVPEPGSLALLAVGFGLFVAGRKLRK